jgi:hypothetical protein
MKGFVVKLSYMVKWTRPNLDGRPTTLHRDAASESEAYDSRCRLNIFLLRYRDLLRPIGSAEATSVRKT